MQSSTRLEYSNDNGRDRAFKRKFSKYINKLEDKDLKADLQRTKYQNQTKDKKLQLKLIRNAK